ncbi:putative nucleotidyltransferase, ribonuclease H [Tanacetum coccineum]
MGETKNAKLEQQLIDRDDMLKLLRVNLTKVQDRMRNQANSKRREVTFQVGDYAFLKIQPYRQKSLAKRRYEKLSPRSFGPYRVKRAIGPVAYDLKLPDDAKIHPVFHVSMLKPVHGSFSPDSVASLPITKNWEIDVQSASTVDHRWVLEAGQPVLELLVSWNQRPLEEATWETYDLLAEQFPNFRLEDKAFYRGKNEEEVDENELDKSRDKCPTHISYLIWYYFKHDISRKTIEDLIDNHEYNDALRKTRLGKMDRKAYESLPVRPLYDAITKMKVVKKRERGGNFVIACIK